jgi:hypothetical protein
MTALAIGEFLKWQIRRESAEIRQRAVKPVAGCFQ